MTRVLIGHTGFVGSNLLRQFYFDQSYNSKNIQNLKHKQVDVIYCAGVSSTKWWANQNPEDDQANIKKLWNVLKTVRARKFVHLSTVDVFKNSINVNENTPIDEKDLHPYGLHRYHLEINIQNHFPNTVIIRLPGLYGIGLKKNIIFDFLNTNPTYSFHSQSKFQFYSLSRLKKDIEIVLKNNLSLVHFATEPASIAEIAKKCFGFIFHNETKNLPIVYDFKTIYSKIFGGQRGYFENKDNVLRGIQKFVEYERDKSYLK